MERDDFILKSIKDLKVTITSYNGNRRNITDLVVTISIYESIFKLSLMSEIIISDTIGLIDTIPIIGQEIVNIEYSNGDEDYEFEFYVTDISEFNDISDGMASYKLYLSGKKEMMNAINTFSKSYSGSASDIINKIYVDYLDSSVDNTTASGNSMNIVIPFMKPFAALKMILQNSISNEKTPLFLYEDSKNETNLVSLASFQTKDSKMTLDYSPDIDTTGETLRNVSRKLNKVFNQSFKKGYDNYNNIVNGAYASFVNSIDLATKNYERFDFSYENHSPYLEKDLNDSAESWTFNNSLVKNLYNSNKINVNMNSLSYTNSFNINGIDPFKKAGIQSYYNRMDNLISTAHVNSFPGIKAGDKVTINFKRPVPNLGYNQDSLLEQNLSGNYIISALRHNIKSEKYVYFMELIKEGTLREL